MKRTLFALGILVGALTIATAPAQIVYSFEDLKTCTASRTTVTRLQAGA
jgi:hypothetical protein